MSAPDDREHRPTPAELYAARVARLTLDQWLDEARRWHTSPTATGPYRDYQDRIHLDRALAEVDRLREQLAARP